MLIEPPASAVGDIVFNLIIFFLVCVSVQPDRGRKQTIPKSESKEQKQQQSENIQVALTRRTASINGTVVRMEKFRQRLSSLLKSKVREQDRVVIVKSKPDTPYLHWIQVTGWIEQVGGIVTLEIEEEQTVVAP